MGTHLRVLSESYPMNTNMVLGLDGFQKSLCHCDLNKSISLSTRRVNPLSNFWMNRSTINAIIKTITTRQTFIEAIQLQCVKEKKNPCLPHLYFSKDVLGTKHFFSLTYEYLQVQLIPWCTWQWYDLIIQLVSHMLFGRCEQ